MLGAGGHPATEGPGVWRLQALYRFCSSKMFRNGAPFLDILYETPAEARRDERLRNSGPFVGLVFEDRVWPILPQFLFYNWLYMRAVRDSGCDVKNLTLYSAPASLPPGRACLRWCRGTCSGQAMASPEGDGTNWC